MFRENKNGRGDFAADGASAPNAGKDNSPAVKIAPAKQPALVKAERREIGFRLMDDFDTQMYDQRREIHAPGISRNRFACFFDARMQLVPRMLQGVAIQTQLPHLLELLTEQGRSIVHSQTAGTQKTCPRTDQITGCLQHPGFNRLGQSRGLGSKTIDMNQLQRKH
jgi:hypothetical protein